MGHYNVSSILMPHEDFKNFDNINEYIPIQN
jgi:hypothetical protein